MEPPPLSNIVAVAGELERHRIHFSFFSKESNALLDRINGNWEQYHRLSKEVNGLECSVFSFPPLDKAYQLNDDGDDREDKKVALMREMSFLKSQAEKLRRRQELAAEKADSHLVHLGKISCRRICAALIVKLPREIRDLVYEQLNRNDDVHIYEVMGTSDYWPSYALKTRQPRPDRPPIFPEDPQYWDPEYIGHEMKSELVENWFRTATFKFAFKFTDIATFITGKDTLGFGLSPGKLVSKVCFWFSQYCLETSWPNSSSYYDAIDRKHPSPRAKLLHDMENLTMLRKGVRISITIFDNKSWHPERSLKFPEEYFEIIFPVLSRLRDAEHKVSVFLEGEELREKHCHILEFNFDNAEFTVQGWMRKFEEYVSGPGLEQVP